MNARKTLSVLFAAAGTALSVSSVHAQSAPVLPVAISGDPAPGLAPGVTYSVFDLALGFAYINNSSTICFSAVVAGTGITDANDRTLLRGPRGALGVVIREGDPAPDTAPGVVIASITDVPAFAGDGSVAFRASLSGPGVTASNDFAMFGPLPVGSGSGLRLAARTGAFAPGAPGSTFSGFLAPSVNSVHEVAFWGSYTGSGLLALFVGVPGSDPGTISTLPYGNLSHIFSVGDAAEGFVPGVTYSTFTMDSTPQVPINATGQIIYRGTVTGPGIGAANDDAIWGGTPGSTHRIAVAGDPAGSGTIGGGINGWNSTFLTPVLTDSGAVAYLNFIVGSPTGSNFGIYRSIILGGPDRVARVGDLAPGPGPSGPTHVYAGTFSSLDSGSGNGVPRMNNLNGVTFRAAITGAGVTAANDVGIWGHNDAGVLGLVVRESDAVPAAGAGVTLATIAPQPPCLNGVNRVAFRATLAGTGVTAANDEAILATNRMNQLVVAAREGVGIEVAPGVVRTLLNFRAITGPGTQDGNSTSWNDKCELVFHATLNDGREGIFVSDVNATCRPTITAQPTDATSCRGGTAMFTVAATSPSSGGLASVPTYQWRKIGAGPGGADLILTHGIGISGITYPASSGETTPTLTITGVRSVDAGGYACTISNVCGSVSTVPAVLRVCAGDFNCSGTVAIDDIFAFLSAWFAGNPLADFNGVGGIGIDDIFDFLAAWFAGCL